jgi:hypothetical protein
VVAAVRDLNRLELVGESARALVETLSAAVPGWLAQVVDVPGWSRRYGRRVGSWKMPASKTRQDALAIDYARLRPARRGLRTRPARVAAGAARSSGPADRAAAELHLHHREERAGGGQAAGEEHRGR